MSYNKDYKQNFKDILHVLYKQLQSLILKQNHIIFSTKNERCLKGKLGEKEAIIRLSDSVSFF